MVRQKNQWKQKEIEKLVDPQIGTHLVKKKYKDWKSKLKKSEITERGDIILILQEYKEP